MLGRLAPRGLFRGAISPGWTTLLGVLVGSASVLVIHRDDTWTSAVPLATAILLVGALVIAVSRPFLLPSLILLSYTVLGPVTLLRWGNFVVLPYHLVVPLGFLVLLVSAVAPTGSPAGKMSRTSLWFFFLYGGFLAVLTMSYLQSAGDPLGFRLLINYGANLLLIVILVMTLKTETHLRLTLRALLVVTAVGGGLGLIQALLGPDVSLSRLVYGELWEFGWGLVGYDFHPASFGLSMLVGFLPALALYLSRSWEGHRLGVGPGLLAATLLLSLAGVVLSGSRSAWAGTAAGVTYLLLRRQAGRHWRTALAVGLSFSIAVAALGFAFGPSVFREKVTRIFGPASDFSVTSRLALYHTGIQLWLDSPLLGIGLGRFYEEALPYVPSDVGAAIIQPHSVFLGILTEAGLVGFILYLGVLSIAFAAGGARGTSGEDGSASLALGLQAGLIGITVDALFHNQFFDNHLWFVVGLMLALRSVRSRIPAGAAAGEDGV